MRLRFFIQDLPSPPARLTLSGDELHHARVTRVRENEEVELFDGRGHAALGRAVEVSREKVAIDVIGETTAARESPVAIELAMSLIQLEKFELVLQKASELGVSRLIPLIARRGEVPAERIRSRADRWKKIVQEAVKQSGRCVFPMLDEPRSLEDLLRDDIVHIVFDSEEVASASPQTFSSARIYIGPEGGWSDEELAAARTHGAVFHRLGPRRLRAETAAISALSIIAWRYGDLSLSV